MDCVRARGKNSLTRKTRLNSYPNNFHQTQKANTVLFKVKRISNKNEMSHMNKSILELRKYNRHPLIANLCWPLNHNKKRTKTYK